MVRLTSPRLPSSRVLPCAALATALFFSNLAAARAEVTVAAADSAPISPLGASVATTEMPAPQPTAAAPASAVEEGMPIATAVVQPSTRAPNVSYGVAARLRWVSVPAWLLNVFTKKNVPLSSYSAGAEFFRRKGEFEFVVSLAYTSLSPPDGNWLGRGHDATVDTDYVQFKGLGLIGADATFVWHTFFNDWIGMHYGAGIGLGLVTGQMLRTSNGTAGCTEATAGNVDACHPIGAICANGVCSDASLAALQPGTDRPDDPHRFVDNNVPPVLPIVNVVVGVDFRLPHVRGWEAKIEGGFYDAFFLGGAAGYTF
jgi:hypothetical protein